jgi:hypothetical protein
VQAGTVDPHLLIRILHFLPIGSFFPANRRINMSLAHAARDTGISHIPANLADPGARLRLSPASVTGVARLAEIWRLTAEETCALIGIFKGLRLLFSEKLADEWVGLPNKGPLYAGCRPLDVMIEGGIPSLLLVRRHVDALRGGL